MGSSPTGTPDAGGVGKNCIYRPVEKSPAQIPYRRKFVSIFHDGLCSQWCAGQGVCGVIKIFGVSLTLMITVTVQKGWLYGRMLTPMASHAHGAIVETSATMRVQNHAGSPIDHDSC